MKKTLIGLFLLLSFLIITNEPAIVHAAEEGDNAIDDGYETVDQNTKYYKTITEYHDNNYYNPGETLEPTSHTIEITKEEYLEAGVLPEIVKPNRSTTIETTYKRMTTYLQQNGSYYRYKNELNWKNYPSVRSYDIIGIGFLSSVKPVNSSRTFELYYCRNSNGCTTTNPTAIKQTFTYGSSAVYQLPSYTDLYALKATYYFNVEKTNSGTLYNQAAYGDYSHAITSVTMIQAMQHTVIQNIGIDLDDVIYNKYDTISVADVYWHGTW